MLIYTEGNINLVFSDEWQVTKYDDWPFYRNQFTTSCCGNKAVDFLAYNPNDKSLWLIELKDYRQSSRNKPIDIWNEVSIKVRDTLAGIFVARINRTHDNHEYATRCSRANEIRVVLHLEQPKTTSKLFPRAFDPADVQQKLRQVTKPIDHHPKVVEINNMNSVPWSAQ